jgi:hypothetical protein
MSFVDDQIGMMVGGSGDFPQRMLEQTYVSSAPLAFAPTSGSTPKYKNSTAESPSEIREMKEEQENLSDRLDKIESEAPKKSKNLKDFWKKHHKKIKTGLLVGIALYAGYRLFLKGRFKLGQGGHTPTDPMPPMETGGEMPTPQAS